jgi:hypothetical protein
VSEIELAIDHGIRVYQISKSGETPYYLHVISTLGSGTIYLPLKEQMTDNELYQLAQS